MSSIDSELGYTRSLVYRLFSILVSYPYDDDINKIFERIESLDELLGILREYNYRDYRTDIKQLRQHFKEDIDRLGRDYFQAEYTYIFDLGVPQPPCPPYGYVYLDRKLEDKTHPPVYDEALYLSKLEDLYRKYGVEVDWRRERPDHIAVELEFLSHLCLIEIQFREGAERIDVRGDQITLLEKNIIPLINSLYKCIRRTGKLKSYKTLYKILINFLKDDLKHIS